MTTSKLLLVAEYTNNAGTEKYLIHLIGFAHKHKLAISLVTYGGEANDQISKLAASYGIAHLRLNNLYEKKQIKKLAQKSLEQIRAYFSQDFFEKVIVSAGTPGSLIKFLELGLKKIYILHTYPHGLKQRIFGRLFSRNFPKDTLLICVSEFSKSKVETVWGKNLRTLVVRNGVPEVSNLERVSKATKIILTLGSLEKYKNPDLWLKIVLAYLELHPQEDIRFIWAGEGSLLDSMRRKIPKLYRGQIEFIGSVQNPELLLQQTTLYLQTSKVESFGLAVAEALSFGIPCVVSGSGGLPEVVSPTCSKVILGTNPKDFVEAMSSILSDNSIYLEMSQNAVRHHLNVLSLDGWEERLSKVIGS